MRETHTLWHGTPNLGKFQIICCQWKYFCCSLMGLFHKVKTDFTYFPAADGSARGRTRSRLVSVLMLSDLKWLAVIPTSVLCTGISCLILEIPLHVSVLPTCAPRCATSGSVALMYSLFSPQKYCNNKYLPSWYQARGKGICSEMHNGLIPSRSAASKLPTTAVQRSGFSLKFTVEITDSTVWLLTLPALHIKMESMIQIHYRMKGTFKEMLMQNEAIVSSL